MDNPFPFFYYDILSRIVPGAVTLAVLWEEKVPPAVWLSTQISAGAQEKWKEIVAPIVLFGICYVIGVIFEVADYFPGWHRFEGMMRVTKYLDNVAFLNAVKRVGSKKDIEDMSNLNASHKDVESRRNEHWEKLTFLGGSKSEMKAIFEHCHRFQAEQKMFMHLLYPTLLFVILHTVNDWKNPFAALTGIGLFVLFSIGHYSRNTRRWLQTIVFSRLIEAEDAKAENQIRAKDY